MTRIVSFIDSMSSVSVPLVTGGSQEDYTIANNQVAAATIFTVDSASYKSAFFSFELFRSETVLAVTTSFLQAGTGILSFNGTAWELSIGNYQGDDLIQDALTTDETITLSVSTASGVGSLQYTSGNMLAVYAGEIKMFITRIATT